MSTEPIKITKCPTMYAKGYHTLHMEGYYPRNFHDVSKEMLQARYKQRSRLKGRTG